MDKHPGGNIIKEFIGKDCTVFFRIWHPTHVFNNPQIYGEPISDSNIEFLDEPKPAFCESGSGSDGASSRATSEEESKTYYLPTRPKELGDADLDYLNIYADAEKRGFFKGTNRYLK